MRHAFLAVQRDYRHLYHPPRRLRIPRRNPRLDHLPVLHALVLVVVNVRRLTLGQISFLCLAELARAGGARGNFAEYKVDLAIEMSSDKKQNLTKIIAVSKGWAAPVGTVGRFTLDVRDGTLRCNAPPNEQEAPL